MTSGSTDAATKAFENKEIVRRLMEDVLGRGRLQLLPELVAGDYVGHFAIGDHYGPEGVRIEVVAYRTAFPDLVVTLDDLLADGDKVIRRFTVRGIHRGAFLAAAASGRPVVLSGIGIDRMVRGRLVESWVQVDGLPGMKCRLAANSLEDESVFRGDGDGTRAPTRNVLLVYHLGWWITGLTRLTLR